MKSLIILKGLVKEEKKNWISQEGLETFFLDYEYQQTLYSTPEIIKKSSTPSWDYLGRIKEKPAHASFLGALNCRLESGCLVVIDPGLEKCTVYEDLALAYGYTVFYKVFPIPQDYLNNPKKYSNPMYRVKNRDALKEELNRFIGLQFTDKNIIETYHDLEKYWKENHRYQPIVVPDKDNLWVFSDIHGNLDLLEKAVTKDKIEVLDWKIFLGDYIDGEDKPGSSRKMIEYLFSYCGGYNYWLEGNHERRLRKYLYYLWKGSQDTSAEIVYKTLPQEWLGTVANEFSGLSPKEAKDWLRKLNNILLEFLIVSYRGSDFIFSHGGLRCLEQLTPKYVGNLIYGNRDMDEYDKCFSRNVWKKTGTWSVHGHCKYPGAGRDEILKYDGVINLDPQIERGKDAPEIIYINLKNFKPCVEQ